MFDAEDNAIETATTDEDGKILFEDIKTAGTYYVQETKAPAGYVLDETKHWLYIGEVEREPVTITAENKERGAVQLTKTDLDTGEVLEGVEFELQKKNDSGEYETVETFTTDEFGQIKTSNTLEAGEYQFVEVKGLDGYRTNGEPVEFTVDVSNTETQEFTMTNEKQKGSIKLIKQDDATNDLLAGATFTLVDAEGEVVEEGLVTNEQGEIVIEDLLLGKYQLIETKAPEGYELDETPIDIEITEDEQVVEVDATNHQITDITVEKKWNNAGGDTTPVTVKLLPTDQTVELSEDNDWKATFTGLRVYDESGEEINYEVEELEVEGYESTVTGDAAEGFIVTNTELTSVSGTKTWVDDNAPDRPESITVKLLANGAEVDTVTVNEASDWSYEFTDLVKYDSEGDEITYTIEEVEVDGYETTIDGFDITNLRVGETEVTGTKTWLDDDSEDRPETITVYLLANGEQVDEVEVTEASNWEYSFTELPKYDDQGVEITYTVDEATVEGYETTINGFDITNLRVGTTEVEVLKLWKDEDETNRPEAIQINLLQNGEFYEEYEVTEENGWELTITDLPKYDDQGVAYEYTISEHDVPGYTAEVDGFEITNTRSEVKTIEITKTWLDDDSVDRPDSIEVELYRSVVDGEKEFVDTITITATDDWSLEVSDLPSFDAEGKAYTYEIEEKAVEGYETSINGFDITNLRVGETEVTGTKTWLDDNSVDRPESITVELFANGEKIDSIHVTAETDWTYTFAGLPAYDADGKAIEYTINEVEVAGYETTINGYDITNTLIPEEPKEPEDPEKEEVPKDPSGSQDPDKSDEDGGTLPKTATNIFTFLMLGMALTGLGITALFIQRKRKQADVK